MIASVDDIARARADRFEAAVLGLVVFVACLSACGAEPGPCPSGAWDDDGASATECVEWSACAAGQRVAEEGSATADRRCAGCPSGTFSSAPNAATCVPWTTCEAGSRVAREGSATRDRVCERCPAGTDTSGPNQSRCVPPERCPAGTRSVGTVCEACAAGEHCPGGEAPASPCGPSTWDHDADPATACAARTECSAGQRVEDDGNATSDRTCAPCAAGTYSAATNAPACAAWTECAPGEHVDLEGSATSDRACAPCALGTYSDEPNAASCAPWTACGAGEVEGVAGTDISDRACVAVGWTRQFGTSAAEGASAVAIDDSGNTIVAGFTAGALPGQTSAGGDDAFVRKYDPDGALLWTRQFGSAARDAASAVGVDGSGNVLVAGITLGALPAQTSAGGSDAFVRKYHPDGALLWTRQLGSASGDRASSVSADDSGNVVVAGTIDGALPSPGGGDAFVRKYDPDGVELWTRQLGSDAHDEASSVSVDASGNVVVAGMTLGALPGQTSAGGADAFVRKYDPAGVEVWTRQFGTSSEDAARAVSVDGGEVIVAGMTRGALTDQASAGEFDVFVRKYDPAGAERWTRQLGTIAWDEARSVTVDGSGDVIVAGLTWGTLPGQTSAGSVDAFVRKYDGSGDLVWTRQLGSWFYDAANSVSADGSGDVIVCGRTGGALPGQTSAGNADGFLMRLPP